MGMEFIFRPTEKTDWRSLHQGDVLQKTPKLREAIAQAHPYYADASDYTHFLVLTQSCDLVLRGGKPGSRYITLAAVRPLSIVVSRLVEKYKFPDFQFPFQVCQKDKEIFVTQALERLLHNTEEEFFFLRKGSHPSIHEDYCGFLPLAISLRSSHYEACITAKIAQLEDVFQAKLGWLAGHQYSRVATPDIEEHIEDVRAYKRQFFDDVLFGDTAWLTPTQFRALKEKFVAWRRANPEAVLDKETAQKFIDELPSDLDVLANRVIDQLLQNKIIDRDEAKIQRAKHIIANDRIIRQMV
jgi:hypothetical protein